MYKALLRLYYSPAAARICWRCSLKALLRACSCSLQALLRACSCSLKALLVMLLTYALVHVPPIRRARKVVFSQILDLRRPSRRALVADMHSHRVAL